MDDFAGHRIVGDHDCFLMNCRSLGEEVRQLRERLSGGGLRPSVEPAGMEEVVKSYSVGNLTNVTEVELSDDLEAAWREAEAALPDGWWFRVTRAKSGAVSAVAADPSNRWDWKGTGTSPAEALAELAAALRGRS